jgi:mono/diheme cytochrome c family protein
MTTSRRILRGVAIVTAIAAGLMLAAGGYVYVASERVIHRKYVVPLTEVAVPSDSAAVAEGRRLAAIRGCFGCHGKALQGEVFRDDASGRAVAPNLTRVAHEYSTAEVARAIRYGIRANGEGLQIMPSPMYYHLSDTDLGRIIGFLRTAPRVEGLAYEFRPSPRGRWQMVTGEWYPLADDILRMGPRMRAPEPADTLAHGEYLARTACTECHGPDLEGDIRGSPDLVVAAAYSFDDFNRLLRTGVAVGNRELWMMSDVSRSRFSHFTDAEVRSLHSFLRARAAGASSQ